VDERQLNIIDVRERFAACGFPIFQRDDGKRIEVDLQAKSSDDRVVLVEVKKTQDPIGSREVEEFQEKIVAYQNSATDVTVLPAFFPRGGFALSLGGFTGPAAEFCKQKGIATAERIKW